MKAWSFGNLFSSLAVPAGLQKRLVSFLLQRAIGHFLEDSLDLEKLDIELSNGIVHLTDLRLNSKVNKTKLDLSSRVLSSYYIERRGERGYDKENRWRKREGDRGKHIQTRPETRVNTQDSKYNGGGW
jgi:hypothetical protein